MTNNKVFICVVCGGTLYLEEGFWMCKSCNCIFCNSTIDTPGDMIGANGYVQ